MRLWTWQKRGFSPADRDSKVESLENSVYLNDPTQAEASRFNRAYKKLCEKLETCQFHWYFVDEDEAKSEASHIQYYDNDRMLWEVNIPNDKVFKRVCSKAWILLLEMPSSPPLKLTEYWKTNAPGSKFSQTIKEWEQGFYDFWKSKSKDELWELLFLDEYVEGCTQILLRHPLEESWVKRNPEKEGKWWDMFRGNMTFSEPHVDPLPCLNCHGR